MAYSNREKPRTASIWPVTDTFPMLDKLYPPRRYLHLAILSVSCYNMDSTIHRSGHEPD